MGCAGIWKCTRKYLRTLRKDTRKYIRCVREKISISVRDRFNLDRQRFYTIKNRIYPCPVCDGKGTVFAMFKENGIWWSYSCRKCNRYPDDHWLGDPIKVKKK